MADCRLSHRKQSLRMSAILTPFQRIKFRNSFILVLQVGLGVLFVYASLDKIWNPGLFAKAISNYRLLPLPLLHAAAIILPWIELLCGLALIVNCYPRAANALICSMLLVFTLAIVIAIVQGFDFNCGCITVSNGGTSIGTLKVLQNIGLIGISGLLEYRFRLASDS